MNRNLNHESRWTFLRKVDSVFSMYRCACGTVKAVRTYHVKNGWSASCGCLRREVVSAMRTTHGATDTKEYRVWCHMIERCYNPNMPGFEKWGGRGIRVDERWKGSFEAFLSDMGPCPQDKLSIERVDNNGDYRPGNCKWADGFEQSNNLRNNVLMDVDGESLTVAQAARKRGLKYATVYRRYVIKKESVEMALRPV